MGLNIMHLILNVARIPCNQGLTQAETWAESVCVLLMGMESL